jgi:Zn-dependent protease
MLGRFNDPLEILAVAIAFLIAITVHEYSHAFASDHLGDPTPRLSGRLTLNPFAHLDLLGTLMILFAPFGWAKPVAFDPFNLRNPRRDTAIISLAGPLANITAAILFSVLLRIAFLFLGTHVLLYFLEIIIILNVNLAVFNLIPIHPLDGFKIVEGFLPEDTARQWAQLESLGYIMILLLIFPLFGHSPVLSFIQPITSFILNLLLPNTGII